MAVLTWVGTSFGTNVKLEAGVLSGTIFANKISSSTAYNNTIITLIALIKSNNIVVDQQNYTFTFGTSTQRFLNLSGTLNYSNITIETYVYDSLVAEYTATVSKSFSNSLGVPNAPILEMIDSYSTLQKLLKWNKVAGLTTYNIESLSPISDPNWITFGGDFEVGELNDIGNNQWGLNIVKGTLEGVWKYRIRAKNSSGYSTYSNTVSYTVGAPPPIIPPTAPILSSTSSGFGLIGLSWTGTNPVDVERADNINGYSVLVGSLSSNSVDYYMGDTTQTYYFRVRSQNLAGYSPYSNVITFSVVGSAPPPPIVTVPDPPIITSSAYGISDGSIVNVLISWLPISGATSYNAETQSPTQNNYTSFGDANYNGIGDGSGKIGFSAPISSGNGNYLFRVRAKNSSGYSSYSNVVIVTRNVITTPPPTTTVPDPPIFTMIDSQDPLSKLLRWNQVSGITTYNIESSSPITDPLWITFGGDFEVGELNNIGSGLWGVKVIKGTQDGLWKYRIRAKNSVGYSNYSNIVSYFVGDPSHGDGDPITHDNKNLLSILTRLFAMGTGLSLLGVRK